MCSTTGAGGIARIMTDQIKKKRAQSSADTVGGAGDAALRSVEKRKPVPGIPTGTAAPGLNVPTKNRMS